MKSLIIIGLFLNSLFSLSQSTDTSLNIESPFLKKLRHGDSVTYYQCHVEEAIQQLSTVSGQTLTGNQQKYTITEKYIVKLKDGRYVADYYSSSLTAFPNRKFSGLKIRERPYWDFKKEEHLIYRVRI